MSWDTTLTNRLRFYIGDIDSPEKYSDIVLSQYIAIAALYVSSEIDVGVNNFTVDTDTPSMSPDPTSNVMDPGVGNLFVLKAAEILTLSEVRKDTARYGIKIRDDLTSYDATSALGTRTTLAKQFQDSYQKAKWEWEIGNRPAVRAIFNSVETDQSNFFNGIGFYDRPNREVC